MNFDTLEALAKAAVYEKFQGRLHYFTTEYYNAANPETILTLIALLREMNVLIYDAIETGDDDPLREALAKYEEFIK